MPDHFELVDGVAWYNANDVLERRGHGMARLMVDAVYETIWAIPHSQAGGDL